MSLSAASTNPHGAHLALVVGVLAALALVATVADLSSKYRRVPGRLRIAALLSAAAGSVHAAVAPQHWREAASVGSFFVAAALGQLIWSALVLTRSSRVVLVGGVIANLGLLALWSLSRTVGVPLGPEVGVVEPVGVADLLASASELSLVVLVSVHLLRTAAGRTQPTPPAAIIATPRRAAATPMS